MKHSKADVRGKARTALDVRFEPQNLTSYSGLILFQHFFYLIGIKERLWGCFRHLKVSAIYSHHVIKMLLIVHLIIGHRRLRDVEYYRDDETVKRVLGLKRLPDVSTISRSLGARCY
ncbi:MAG: transposase [Pseudomonadota bacterium]|nr:transposase [Pseudomonadota bacterium]